MLLIITSEKHSDNATITMNDISTTQQLSHEFGHAIYHTQNAAEYKDWLIRNPDQQRKGGPGKGGPSGLSADAAEQGF